MTSQNDNFRTKMTAKSNKNKPPMMSSKFHIRKKALADGKMILKMLKNMKNKKLVSRTANNSRPQSQLKHKIKKVDKSNINIIVDI